MYRLRGHHLLCLLGYRGMGYSAGYVAAMTALHTDLRRNAGTRVHIVLGPDDLCAHFPEDQDCHCQERTVMERDARILAELGLKPGATISWREIEERITDTVVPADIPRFCATCPWLSYGVCEEGVRRIHSGQGLYPVAEDGV